MSRAGLGTDRTEQIHPLVVGLLQGTRAASGLGPDTADRSLLADPRLVLEPDLDALARMRFSRLFQRLREDVFL